jgi:hypothetical protein
MNILKYILDSTALKYTSDDHHHTFHKMKITKINENIFERYQVDIVTPIGTKQYKEQ